MERETNSVVYKGKRYKAKKKWGLITLDLSSKNVNDISEIEGLERLTSLQALNLGDNQIKEIS